MNVSKKILTINIVDKIIKSSRKLNLFSFNTTDLGNK